MSRSVKFNLFQSRKFSLTSPSADVLSSQSRINPRTNLKIGVVKVTGARGRNKSCVSVSQECGFDFTDRAKNILNENLF